jgi:hypothetical protein
VRGLVKPTVFPADRKKVDLTVSRPVKILALILVIAGVGGVASLSMMGKSSSSADAQLSVAQIRARAHGSTQAPAAKSRTPSPAKAKVVAPVRVTHKAAPKPKVAPKPAPVVAANGLPTLLNDALHDHRVVVVSVFDPQSQTDAISYAEARAGAGDVGPAGFLGVSVLDDSVAGPLTSALPGGGLLPVPGVLIYRRPGTLVERVDGFADRDAIAQLALAALTAPAITAPAVPATPAVAAAAPVVTPPATTTP